MTRYSVEIILYSNDCLKCLLKLARETLALTELCGSLTWSNCLENGKDSTNTYLRDFL